MESRTPIITSRGGQCGVWVLAGRMSLACDFHKQYFLEGLNQLSQCKIEAASRASILSGHV